MYEIVKKKLLASNIYLMDIKAPRVAKAAQPGQFIIVKMHEKSERIPLTICDYNIEKGTVTIVFQVVGNSTKEMAKYEVGDFFSDFVGPLGQPSEFVSEDIQNLKEKKLVFIAGGVGAAPVYPQVKWLNERGIKADVIMGAKSKELLILEDEMRKSAGNVYVVTDDGSYGFKGLVTDMLKTLIEKENIKYDEVITIGPMIMMKFVSKLTKEFNIKTIVSLNTLMVDGTGMCGACRVSVDGKTRFACVEGPEFDGHLVDFDEAMRRQLMYKTEEAKQIFRNEHKHNGGCKCGCGAS